MSILLRVCTVVGAWFLAAVLLFSLVIWARWLAEALPKRRCALCRVRCETLEHCRFGNVCSKCQDAVFRLYHYRTPRLSDEQARRILKNLWRNTEGYEFGGDGWRNGG